MGESGELERSLTQLIHAAYPGVSVRVDPIARGPGRAPGPPPTPGVVRLGKDHWHFVHGGGEALSVRITAQLEDAGPAVGAAEVGVFLEALASLPIPTPCSDAGFELCPWPIALLDNDLRVLCANAEFRAWWGDEGAVGTRPFTDSQTELMRREILRATRWQDEVLLTVPAFGAIPVEVGLIPVWSPRNSSTACWLFLHDLRPQHAARADLERIAFVDPVTGLPNRARLAERLGMALADARRDGTAGAVLAVDLLNFRAVNALYGHRHGDTVLRICGSRIAHALPAEAVTFRSAANEFVVLVHVDDPARVDHEALARAQAVLDVLRPPISVAGTSHRLDAAVGIRCFPLGLESSDDILRDADIALQAAKQGGPGRTVHHERASREAATKRHRLEQDLHHAVERHELVMHLQPQFDLEGTMCAAEALVRWCHPTHGLLAPGAFIPLAEETGLVRDIDAWVVQEACRQIALTQKAGRPLHISVNASAVSLAEGTLCASTLAALDEAGVEARHLTLELTETCLNDSGIAGAASLARLSNAGVRISVDDFGTGYSNLRNLSQARIDELKIDRSLVAPLNRDARAEDLLCFMLQLGHQLGGLVVAEGVETEEQAKVLRRHGCDRVQGYHYARPGPAEEVLLTWLSGAQVSNRRSDTRRGDTL